MLGGTWSSGWAQTLEPSWMGLDSALPFTGYIILGSLFNTSLHHFSHLKNGVAVRKWMSLHVSLPPLSTTLNSFWALPLLQLPLQWPVPFRLDQLHPGAPWQHLTPRSPCILLLPAPELLWCSSGGHPWEPTLNWYVYNLEVQGRPTLDLRGKGIMDKCHPFPWANSLGKHLIRLPAEGQLPMVVTYSIRHPVLRFPPSVFHWPLSLTPTRWDNFPNKLPICKSLAQLSFGGIQVRTTCKVLNTVPGSW